MLYTAETVHDALRKLPTDSPYTNTLALALSIMTRGEKLKLFLDNAVRITLTTLGEIPHANKGAEDGNK